MGRNKCVRSLLKVTGLFCAITVASLSLTYRSLSPAKSSTLQSRRVIARIWHGRTLTSKADEYYAYLKEAGINKIEAIEGNLGAQVLRRTEDKTTDFTVISYWESREAIKKFCRRRH